MARHADESLRCSFCRKSEKTVAKLISNPSDYPRAYICDECIQVCASILEDDRAMAAAPEPERPGEPHRLLSHPLASQFMATVEQWVRQDSLGSDALQEFAEMRNTAIRMIEPES